MSRKTDDATNAPRSTGLRDRIARGTSTARRLIERVRELATRHAPVPTVPPVAEKKPAVQLAASTVKDVEAPANTAATVKGEALETVRTPVALAPEFVTTTMANVLLAQGRVTEAAAVFDQVLARDPSDAGARRGLARTRALTGRPAGGAPEPASMLDRAPLPASYGATTARAIPVDPSSLVAFWEVPADAPHSPGATRALRIESRHDDERVARVRYVEPVPRRGDYVVRDVPSGARHDVTVGWRIGGAFVPLASAPAIETPRGRPVPSPAVSPGSPLPPVATSESIPPSLARTARAPAESDTASYAAAGEPVVTPWGATSSGEFARDGRGATGAWSGSLTGR